MCLHCCIGISLPFIYFSGSKHLEFMSPFYFSPSSFNLSSFVMFKTCGDPAFRQKLFILPDCSNNEYINGLRYMYHSTLPAFYSISVYLCCVNHI